VGEPKGTERGILFFSAFFAGRLAGFFPLPFPEALRLDADFWRVDLRLDLGLDAGSEDVVDSASREIEVVAKLLRTLDARNRLDKMGRVDKI
jgi:hypothetical protein